MSETQTEYKKAIRHKPTQKWVQFGNDDSELSVRIIELVDNFKDCFISCSRGYLDVLLTTSTFNGTPNYGIENYLEFEFVKVKATYTIEE
jgi:hypothetical protein